MTAASGHERTFADVRVTSAFPLIATESRYHTTSETGHKQTCSVASGYCAG